MGCLLVLLMAISARLALVIAWLFTDLLSRAFDTWIVPLLGFIFLPWTTLIYVLVYSPVHGVNVIGWFLLIFGFIIDVGTLAGGNRARSR